MLWSSSHTAHVHDDKLVTFYKDVSEHYRDCNGNSSAHVQGRTQLDLLSGLCNTTLTYMYHDNVLILCNLHAHAHYWDIISRRVFSSLAIEDIYETSIVQQCRMLESRLDTCVLAKCLSDLTLSKGVKKQHTF